MNQHVMTSELAGTQRAETASVSLRAIIGRIEEAVDAETAAIRVDVKFDIAQSNMRKSRHLYELNRAMRGLTVEDLGPNAQRDLERLRSKLEINETAILAHLNAVKEVAGLIQDAIERAETDGTYSAGQFGRL